MKKYLYKITALSVALLFTFAAAQADDLKRSKKEVYKVAKGHSLIVETRFSDVNIVKSTTDQVEINVTIEVEGDSRRDKALFEGVKVNLKQSGNEVSVITDLPSRINSSDLEIRIDIKAPTYIQANIDLQYGNLYLEELEGKADLDLRYSNFKSDVLASPDNQFQLAYMDQVTIGYVNKALIDISYSEINIKKAGVLSGRSAYSEYRIGDIDQLSLSMSKYDEWEINDILDFSATSRYAEIEIGYVKKSFVLDANFGECEVSKTSANFKTIELDLSYTDCEMNIDGNASYTLKVDGSYADVEYPKDRFEGSFHSRMMSLSIDGTIGKSPTGKVLIETSYGDVEL
ncbi:hypothetical protein [Salinivirga cyanobacteriivorans]